MRHLRRQLVERERRDQAEDAPRHARRDGDEVGVRERRKRREPVQPPGDRLDDAGVTHGVERLALDAEAKRCGHAEAAAMPAKQLDLTLEGSGAHGDILPSNFHDVKAICPGPSGRSETMSWRHQPAEHEFLRRLASQPGHDASGGVQELDRAAALARPAEATDS